MIVNGAFERLRQSGIVDGPRRRIAFTGFISAARRTDQVLRIGLFSKPQALSLPVDLIAVKNCTPQS